MKLHHLLLILILLYIQTAGKSQDTDSLMLNQIFDLSLNDLAAIKVQAAGKKEQKIESIPASVVIITHQDIQKFGYTTLKEVLNQVPGLYLWDDYHVRGRINIGVRGYTSSDNIIILVNGINQVEGVYNEYLLTKGCSACGGY